MTQPTSVTNLQPASLVGTPQSLQRDVRPRWIKFRQVATLIASGCSIEETAAESGIQKRSIMRWYAEEPQFVRLLTHLRDRAELAEQSFGLARKSRRLAERSRAVKALSKIMDRNEAATGNALLVKDAVAAGDQVIEIQRFDYKLERSHRDALDAIAKEMGNMFERPTDTAAPHVTVNVAGNATVLAGKLADAELIDLHRKLNPAPEARAITGPKVIDTESVET